MATANNDVLSVNPILDALATKGSGKVVELRGFVGPSDSTVVRLYESLEMVSYLEIPKSEVLHAVADPKSANGAIKLYVRGNTELLSVSSQQIRADARMSTGLRTNIQEGAYGRGIGPRAIARGPIPRDQIIGPTTADTACRALKKLIDFYQDCLDNDECDLPYGGKVQLNEYLRDYIQGELNTAEQSYGLICEPFFGPV